MEPAIEIRDLRVVFPSARGPVTALDGITLTVQPGQVFGFLGPNGAGKTTTMHVLLGFLAATSGEARIFGEDVRQSIARRRIGYLPEQPDTYRFLTGRELLTFTGRLFLMREDEIRKAAGEILERVGMAAAADRRIATYSRGMKQRICLAQALINSPDLVILDEPTSGMDPIGRMAIRGIISDLRQAGKTVFFSSHELSEVELVCDHMAILAGGQVTAEGAAADLVPAGESLERFFMKTIRINGEGRAPRAGADARRAT